MALLQSADRVLMVLFLLAELGESGPAELGRKLGVSKGTAFNLLRTLEKHHLATFDPLKQRYRLGPGVFRLIGGTNAMLDLREAARATMEYLRDRTNETVTLSIRAGTDRVCTDAVESRHELRTTATVGHTVSLHAGATGWVLLAWESSEAIEQFLTGAPFPAITPQTLTDADALRAALRQTREQGYAIRGDDPVPGVRAVSVPVWHQRGVVASLTVSGPAQRWTVPEGQRHLPTILKAAAEISAVLGYRAPVGDGTQPITSAAAASARTPASCCGSVVGA